MRKPILFLGILFATLFPGLAFALDGEFYTYNGFIPITQAFQKMALISSSTGYRSLFAVVVVTSILVSGALGAIKGAMGEKQALNPLMWFFPLIGGLVIYLGFFVGSGTLYVYDTVTNQTTAIGGVPNGVIMIAGTLNRIERGFVDLISTAGTPGDYQRSAGGIGFALLEKSGNISFDAPEGSASLQRYANDCVVFEMARPDSLITLDEINNGPATGSLLTSVFSKANNPAVPTVTYLSSTGTPLPSSAGQATTCQNAYNNLVAYYETGQNVNFSPALKKLCSMGLYNTDAVGLASCKQEIENTLSMTSGTAMTAESYLSGSAVAQDFIYTLKTASPTMSTALIGNQAAATGGVSKLITANTWMPFLRAMVMAITIAFTPVLIIFLPSNIGGKAFGTMFGLYFGLMAWGVCDALMHGAIMDYAVTYFDNLKNMHAGLQSFLTYPDGSTATLAMFGTARMASLTLAGIATGLVLYTGSHALGQIGGMFKGTLDGSAAAGGAGLLDHSKGGEVASRYKGLVSGESSVANLKKYGLEQIAEQETFSTGQGIGAMRGKQALADSAGMTPENLATQQNSFGTVAAADGGTTAITAAGGYKHTSAAGTSVMGTGNSVDYASIQGGNLALGKAMKESYTESAATTLAQDDRLSRHLDQTLSSGDRKSKDFSSATELKSAIQSRTSQEIMRNSGLTHSIKNEKGETLNTFVQGQVEGGVSAPVPIVSVKAKGAAGGKYSVSMTRADGRTATFNVSEAEKKQLDEAQSRARTNAIKETLSTSSGRDYLRRYSEASGLSTAVQAIDRSSSENTASMSINNEAMTSYLKYQAQQNYPQMTEREGVARAGDDLVRVLNSNDAQERDKAISGMEQFGIANMGHAVTPDGRTVGERIGDTKANVTAGQNAARNGEFTSANSAFGQQIMKETSNLKFNKPQFDVKGPTGQDKFTTERNMMRDTMQSDADRMQQLDLNPLSRAVTTMGHHKPWEAGQMINEFYSMGGMRTNLDDRNANLQDMINDEREIKTRSYKEAMTSGVSFKTPPPPGPGGVRFSGSFK